MIRTQHILLVLLALLLCACSSPAKRSDAFAATNGFTRQVISGADFSHLVYIAENRVKSRENNAWHVYIEGDGLSWIRRGLTSTDPTSPEPLMLQLMAQDSHPAIYLGRPCYNGIDKNSDDCTPWMWTYGRYSEQVVESMHAALTTLVKDNAIDSLVLMGHSGGGTLAMLLAERVPQVRSVVTLGGNLDIDAWTEKHGYTKLVFSLNPAKRASLPRQIKQLHFVGANDKNVPPGMLQAAIKQQENANMFVLYDLGHKRGWSGHWTDILIKIDTPGDES